MLVATLLLCALQAPRIEPPITRTRCFVGQAIVLRAGFALPAAALESGLVQIFQQPLDVPIALDVPWWDGIDGLVPLGAPASPTEASASLVLNGAVASFGRLAHTELDGSKSAWFALDRSYVARRAGELVLAPSTLRGTHATRFADDALLGSRALDGEPFELRGAACTLQVLELPESGRPPGFRGAIGEFGVRTRWSSEQATVGDELRLTIEVDGPGNHGLFELAPPRLPSGLTQLGTLASSDAEHSTLEMSLRAEQPGEYALPMYEVPRFDPWSERYAGSFGGFGVLRVVAAARSQPALAESRAPLDASAPAQAGSVAVNFLLRLVVVFAAVFLLLFAAAVWVRRRGAR